MTAKELYDRDFFEWSRCNAALLRSGRFDQADIEHIAEEIEDMGKRDRRELESRLQVLLAHLVKWRHQPQFRSSSWETTIDHQRDGIQMLLRDAPSLRNRCHEILPLAYAKAVRDASKETKLPHASFPSDCPFTLDQILDEHFLPG
jgi:hypothetical protein